MEDKYKQKIVQKRITNGSKVDKISPRLKKYSEDCKLEEIQSQEFEQEKTCPISLPLEKIKNKIKF